MVLRRAWRGPVRAQAVTRLRARKKPVVVIAGEDRHDRRLLRTLLEEFCPDVRGRLVEIRDSVRLRAASGERLAERARTLVRKAKARAEREGARLACVFVHEDLDRPADDDYFRLRQRVQDALCQAAGTAHYVLAAAEVEAWLLLFPDALASFNSSWLVPRQYRGRDTALLPKPKEILRSRLSRRGSGVRYRESDAPEIIREAIRLGTIHKPTGTNRSWTALRDAAVECCRSHVRKDSVV